MALESGRREKQEDSARPVIAAIDIGTNSIRLRVVRVEDEQRLTPLAEHREVVRLGEGEFETNRMTGAAIARGALVCAKFAEVARSFGAREIIAFATSAAREAENRDDFIDRVRREAGMEVRIISGAEEARLIWLGVSSALDLSGRRAVLIDIGGGSTEVIVGTAAGHEMLDSLKLGAIRLSNRYFNHENPVSQETFALVQGYVLGMASQVIRRVKEHGFDLAVGSSGTINALADIIARRNGEPPLSETRSPLFRLADLRDTVRALSRMTLDERRRVPGMDPNRAEIILGGAVIVLTLMEALCADRMSVSDRGMRDGILLDYLFREEDARARFQSLSVRRRSVLQLAAGCNYEAEHAAHTARLALRLFDELRRLKQHEYGDRERELLDYAALLHDIGTFLSHSNHQKHAYYLISNSELLGFNETEIEIIANVALYHRKGFPKKRHDNLMGLSRMDRQRISVLAAILRISEGLDRGHMGLVKDILLELSAAPHGFVLTLLSPNDCQLEVWGVQNNRDLFEYVFGGPLVCRVSRISEGPARSEPGPAPVSAPV